MQEQQTASEEDPTLKAALRDIFAAEDRDMPVPATLQRRISDALDDIDRQRKHPVHSPWRLGSKPLFKLALAASVLIVCSVTLKLLVSGDNSIKLPDQFAADMQSSHDALAKPAAATAALDLAATAKQLSSNVSYAVAAPDFKDGWIPQAANVTRIDGMPTAQILYRRGGAAISLYTLPSTRLDYPADGATYAMTIQGHALAGIVRNGFMYCIIGDAGSSMDDVKHLLEKLPI